MTAPAVAFSRFGAACVMGGALGLFYGFLRPLRPKHTALADGLFLIALYRFWLVLACEICRGDFRFSYFSGLLLGFFLWDRTAGRLLARPFGAFWKVLGAFGAFLTLPVKKILHFIKIMFASGEKWVTIGWNHRRHMTRKYGGPPYGRNKRTIQPDQAGSDAYTQSGEDCTDGAHRIVYVCPDRPADRRE